MTNRSPNLDQAARLLWAPIPEAPKPTPRPQKAWRGLTTGRHLRLKTAWFDGHTQWPPGSLFEVREPTSLGVSLWPLLTGSSVGATFPPVPWSEPNWRQTFEAVRRPSTRKGKR